MCGIAGIIGIEEQGAVEAGLQSMLDRIAHRGPDNEGKFVEPGVGLGHRRLSILDPSPAGHQPMQDPTGRYQLIFNGEVFNYQQVRKQLQRKDFHTGTDTETVLAAYIEMGPSCLELFNGMFTLAIWDREERSLFIARDRLGIKPLYYSFRDGVLVFASELRGVLASGKVARKLNQAVLPEFLMYQSVMAPKTLVTGIQQLMPGAYGIFRQGTLKLNTWWSLNASPEATEMDYPTIKSRVNTLFRESVERRLLSDVPLGAFLSGGIDSSAIVAMMAQVSDQPVDTFSVVFNEAEYDESSYSGLIAKKYNTRHHPILLSPNDFLEALPDALSAMDHPSGDGPNSYVVSRVTRQQGIKVALSGLGGDEVFAGYPVFRQIPELRGRNYLWWPPRFLRKGVAALATLFPGGRKGDQIASLLRTKNNSINELYPLFRTIYTGPLIHSMMGKGELENGPAHWLSHPVPGFEALPELSRISAAEISTYMQNVLLRDTDQMSMAHALEVRVPFLDHELVEFVLGVPDVHKTPTLPKRLLVESMEDLLPEEIVQRKKMGFVFPWTGWLLKDLAPFAGERMNRLSKRGIFDTLQLKNIWKDFQQRKTYLTWVHIWLLVVLEEWIENNRIEI